MLVKICSQCLTFMTFSTVVSVLSEHEEKSQDVQYLFTYQLI